MAEQFSEQFRFNMPRVIFEYGQVYQQLLPELNALMDGGSMQQLDQMAGRVSRLLQQYDQALSMLERLVVSDAFAEAQKREWLHDAVLIRCRLEAVLATLRTKRTELQNAASS